jgi:FMN reductase (NADPH)
MSDVSRSDKLSLKQFLAGLARIISARPHVPASLAGNKTLHTVLERRSVRKFKDDPLPGDVWQTILEAGRLAPSTVNLQTWSFALFTREEWQDFFGKPLPFGAPRAVIVMADVHRAKRVVSGFPYSPLCEYTVGVMNASLAAMNMTIAAEAMGVSSVMLSETGQTGFYDAAYLAQKLDLPRGVVPIMSIVFGYAKAGRPAMPPKLSQAAISFSGRYRETDQAELENWYQQMQAGYQASNWGELFASQIAHYNRRIAEAERDLHELVYYEGPARSALGE